MTVCHYYLPRRHEGGREKPNHGNQISTVKPRWGRAVLYALRRLSNVITKRVRVSWFVKQATAASRPVVVFSRLASAWLTVRESILHNRRWSARLRACHDATMGTWLRTVSRTLSDIDSGYGNESVPVLVPYGHPCQWSVGLCFCPKLTGFENSIDMVLSECNHGLCMVYIQILPENIWIILVISLAVREVCNLLATGQRGNVFHHRMQIQLCIAGYSWQHLAFMISIRWPRRKAHVRWFVYTHRMHISMLHRSIGEIVSKRLHEGS